MTEEAKDICPVCQLEISEEDPKVAVYKETIMKYGAAKGKPVSFFESWRHEGCTTNPHRQMDSCR